jgi:hypothetical protein
VEEVIAALELALEAEHNEDSMVLSWFRREVRGMVKDMDALIERVLNVSTVHNTPDDYRWFYETL